MSTKVPVHIISDNLSFAWAAAFLKAFETSKKNLAPMTISITNFRGIPPEHSGIRAAVDRALAKFSKETVRVSAFTIFPEEYRQSLENPNSKELADGYLSDILPRMRAQNAKNAYGTYFERMVAFRGSRRKNEADNHKITNQLEHIVQVWKRGQLKGTRPRHSALVVSCFDPAKDHTGQHLRGFPCLTQVSFGYDNSGGLSLTAFYPTQYLFDRAYGNYLGLANLGKYVAEQMGLTLVQLNFFIGRPEVGNIPQEHLTDLAQVVKGFVPVNCTEEVA